MTEQMGVPNENRRDAAELVVAIVPALNRGDSVAATVRALRELDRVDRVVVVDDGSSDDTATVAQAAGADVVQLARNRGKGAAVAAGVAAAPEADVILLIDADLAATAGAADRLLDPLLAGEADLAIGVLPPAGSRGGFGTIRKVAAAGIRRACGLHVRAPLSGQRAVRAEFLREGFPSSDRFGLEVAMTIDVASRDGRVVEVDVPMDHRHTGRRAAGFAHRGRQGVDVVRSLLPRVTSARQRIGAIILVTLLVLGLVVAQGVSGRPRSEPLGATTKKVVIFGMEPFGFDDLSRGVTPNLQRLVDQGSLGAMSARGVSRHPSDAEGYLTLGAGARLRATSKAALILPQDTSVGTVSAGQYVTSLAGASPNGEFVAIDGPAISSLNGGPEAASDPGTLAEILGEAGHATALVANSDHPATITSDAATDRAAGLAVMDSTYGIAHGEVDPKRLLTSDVTAPYGVRANLSAFLAATRTALKRSDLVIVDSGDLTRAQGYGARATQGARDKLWVQALRRTDQLLGDVVKSAGPDTLVLVVSVRPPHGAFGLTPMVAWGPGVPVGTIASPSTQRSGVVAITDVAPTVIHALGQKVPDTLPGNPLQFDPGASRTGLLEAYNTGTIVHERTYFGLTWAYIWLHALLYGVLLFIIARRPRFQPLRRPLRWSLLALAALPVSSYLVQLVPALTSWFLLAATLVTVCLAGLIGLFVDRRRANPLSSIAWLCGLTMLVLLVDLWTGSHLEISSWLGYSWYGGGRFYGIPNSSFAVLGASSLLWAGIVVQNSARRSEAIWGVGGVLLLVLISCGAPMLGANVGSMLTLGPVFALFLYVLSGRRIKWKSLFLAGCAMVAIVVVAAAIDLTRAPANRSHLGRFAADFLDHGPSVITDSFFRKQSANLRLSTGSIWSRLIAIVGVFSFYLLVWERRAKDVFASRPLVRDACWAIVGAALLGLLTNDSAPMLVALFVAYLPPVFALVLLDVPDHEPVLLEASTPGPVEVTA